MVQIDAIELAKSYSQFVAVPGGVCITVLTRVMTLRKEIADQDLFLFPMRRSSSYCVPQRI